MIRKKFQHFLTFRLNGNFLIFLATSRILKWFSDIFAHNLWERESHKFRSRRASSLHTLINRRQSLHVSAHISRSRYDLKLTFSLSWIFSSEKQRIQSANHSSLHSRQGLFFLARNPQDVNVLAVLDPWSPRSCP